MITVIGALNWNKRNYVTSEKSLQLEENSTQKKLDKFFGNKISATSAQKSTVDKDGNMESMSARNKKDNASGGEIKALFATIDFDS